MNRFRLLFWVFLFALPFTMRADGPHITLHATEGPWTATVFSAPDPLVTGPVTLSLLVQKASDGSSAPVAGATGVLTLVGSPPVPFAMKQTGANGSVLWSANVTLGRPGSYTLTLDVRASGQQARRFAGALPVEANHGKRDSVVWAVLVPAVFSILFLLNQYGKQGQKTARSRTGMA